MKKNYKHIAISIGYLVVKGWVFKGWVVKVDIKSVPEVGGPPMSGWVVIRSGM